MHQMILQACTKLAQRTCAFHVGTSLRCLSTSTNTYGQRSGEFAVTSAASITGDKYSTSWPFPADEKVPEEKVPAPRTISDDKLRFQMRATFTHGSSIFYPHLKHHPADYKVAVVVNVADLGFSNNTERAVFIQMIGPRFNQGKNEVRLTAEKFANRLENRKYLIYLLEKLVAEAKQISATHCNGEYDD